MENPHDYCIKVCNGLLRSELSAVETYTQALAKHGTSAAAAELRRIRSEHSLSASSLSKNLRDMGGQPDTDSGAWGIFAAAVQGTANLFGPDSAVNSLRRGEETGRSAYQEALLDNDVMAECKHLIREKLLPRAIHHIATLETLERDVHHTAR